MPHTRHAALAGVSALLLAGCGNERTPVPDVATPLDPVNRREVVLEAAGISFQAPGNWYDTDPPRGALVGGVESGPAVVAVWRYPRAEPLPKTRAQLARVRDLLVERVRERDPSFELASARLTRRAGARAIELTGEQTIEGRRVRIRSAHVFSRGAEIVIDAYAPPADFDRLDASVFRPALATLRLRAPAS